MNESPTMNNTLELLLDRRWKKDTYTIGIMTIDGKRFSETCEDKDHLLMIGFHVADYNGNNADAGFNFIIYGAWQWLNYYQGV